ncbi:hypothetical protein CF149_10933 [Pseudomonas psychrophila]|nr:hypothetical protein CF149_10933 [Pseudomonas psychrophila]
MIGSHRSQPSRYLARSLFSHERLLQAKAGIQSFTIEREHWACYLALAQSA